MHQLLAIGEVMAEIRSSDDGFAVNFAGDTFNTAIYCARMLAQPGTVGYLTRLGSEPLSYALIEQAQSMGLDTSLITHDLERNIGIYSVATDAQGERSFHYWRDKSAARELFSDPYTATLPKADIIYLSGITVAILSQKARLALASALRQAKAAGAKIAFDSNYREKLWEDKATARQVISAFWEIADIALPSIDDEMDLMGDADEAAVIARFASKSWHRLAIKRGKLGPAAPHVSDADLPVFLPAATVIDTTAAGDSFNGGYLAALLQKRSEADCLLAGHQLAAQVVGVSGAIMPKE